MSIFGCRRAQGDVSPLELLSIFNIIKMLYAILSFSMYLRYIRRMIKQQVLSAFVDVGNSLLWVGAIKFKGVHPFVMDCLFNVCIWMFAWEKIVLVDDVCSKLKV